MDARQLRILTAVTGLLATSALLTGCSSLQTPSLGLGKTALWGSRAEVIKDNQVGDTNTAAPAGKYIVELRDAGGKSSSSEFNLTGPICTHDALQQAGAVKKFGRIKVELVRPLPSGGWHWIPIEYDRTIRRVPAECDYAILPGDRVIVTEDTGNMFTDMVDHADDIFMSKPKAGKTKNGTFRVAG
jgi:hypothetical protein